MFLSCHSNTVGTSDLAKAVYRPPCYVQRPSALVVSSFESCERSYIKYYQSILFSKHPLSPTAQAHTTRAALEFKDARTYSAADIARLEYSVTEAYNHLVDRHDMYDLGYSNADS